MRKFTAILLTVLLLVTLCACGESGPSEDVVFKNDLSAVVHGVHISPSNADTWGDALNYAKVSKGGSIHIDFEKFAGDSPVYDIGLIDENGLNYDVYDVALTIGDTLTFSDAGGSVTLTVTGTDGAEKTYDVYTYTD